MLKLGLGLDLYRGAALEVPVAAVQLAERLGYHSVWTAEAYGADALSPLAFLAAHTSRIKLATGVVQIDARTPAATAMHAMTIDALAGGGRTVIGLGVSGPQVVEGWHGAAWGSPVTKLRDYTAIMRKVLARDGPVSHDGTAIRLPYDGPGALGQGKPLKSILHPAPGVEIWIAAGGPRNVALAAEVADGWLPMGYGSEGIATYAEPLARGRARRCAESRADLEVFGSLSVQSPTTYGPRWMPASRWSPCMWAAWAAKPTTSTPRPWPAGAGPRPRRGSWTCGEPGAGTMRWRLFPTTTSSRSPCSARPSASGHDGPRRSLRD